MKKFEADMKENRLKNFISSDRLSSRMCELYAAALLLVQPLLVHNGYFDITRTKSEFFWYLTGMFLAGMCLLLVLRREIPHADGRTFAFLAFVGALIVSSLLPGSPEGVWIGSTNRYQGILTNLLYGAACLALCRYGRFGKTARTAMFTGFVLVSLLAVCNHLGWDVFGFIGRLGGIDRRRFISTIGNVDVFSAYIVLMLPVCVSFALRESRPARRIVLYLLSLTGLWAAMAGRCESAVLGLGAAAAMLPVFLGDDADALRRFPLLISGAVTAAELYAILAARHSASLSELTVVLLKPCIAAVIAVAGGVLWLTLHGRTDEKILRARKIYCFVLVIILVLALLLAVLANTALRDSLGETAEKYFIFDDDWGSDRGKVWKSFLTMFAESPPLKKLIGGGAGSLAEWDRAHRIFGDAVTDAAHNEYLHYLLTNGVLGLGAYMLFFVMTARAAMKSRTGRCLMAGCAAYGVQAAVNIAQPFTTPLFLLLLFLCGSEDDAPEEEKTYGLLRALGCLALAAAVLAFGAVNGAPRPLTDPSDNKIETVGVQQLYTASYTQLYLTPGGNVYTEVPPGTALAVTGRTGVWMQVKYDGMTLYVRAASLVPASEQGMP